MDEPRRVFAAEQTRCGGHVHELPDVQRSGANTPWFDMFMLCGLSFTPGDSSEAKCHLNDRRISIGQSAVQVWQKLRLMPRMLLRGSKMAVSLRGLALHMVETRAEGGASFGFTTCIAADRETPVTRGSSS